MQIIYIFMYLITQASVGVVIGYIGLKVSPIIVLLSVSIISTLFFSIFQFKNLKSIVFKMLSNKKLVFYLFLFTAITWVLVYWGTIIGSPGLELMLMILCAGMSASVIQKKIKKTILALLTFILIIIFIPEANILSVIIGILSGVGAYLLQLTSYQLFIKSNINETQILAIRFVPFIFVLVVLSVKYNVYHLNNDMILPIVLIALLIIIPTFLTQKCINLLGAEKFSYMSGLLPISTFIIQDITGVFHTGLKTYCIVIVLTFALVLDKKLKL